MKKYLPHIWLEVYAVALAALHLPRGLVTDEAKYLLNIPYPHPPLVRTLMNWTECLPIQELFWRIVIASMVVQAVWLVWDMGRSLTQEQRGLLAAGWLLSAAIMLQAGTILMAPFTAVQALVFLWLLQHQAFVNKYSALVALFWLASLFTAYQIALFIPVVALLFWRTPLSNTYKIICFGVPVFLLALYTLANPLVPASMLLAGTQNTSLAAGQKFEYVVLLWAVGGSVIFSALGTLGIALKKRWDLALCLLLLIAYVSLSYRPYYAILFTPLFVAGSLAAPRVLCCARSRVILLAIISFLFVKEFGPSLQPSVARQVGHMLQATPGTVLIHGSYGHQWQYELTQPVRQYRSDRTEKAAAIICLEQCADVPDDFKPVMVGNVVVWIR